MVLAVFRALVVLAHQIHVDRKARIALENFEIPGLSLVEPGRGIVNVGALGRPANDGLTNVWLTTIEDRRGELAVEHVPVPYDHERLAREMQEEALPEPFVETVLTGYWTTCLEILPAKERSRGRF